MGSTALGPPGWIVFAALASQVAARVRGPQAAYAMVAVRVRVNALAANTNQTSLVANEQFP